MLLDEQSLRWCAGDSCFAAFALLCFAFLWSKPRSQCILLAGPFDLSAPTCRQGRVATAFVECQHAKSQLCGTGSCKLCSAELAANEG